LHYLPILFGTVKKETILILVQKVLYKNPNRWQLDLIPVIRIRKKHDSKGR